MRFSGNDRFTPRPGIESRLIGDGAVLMDMNSGLVFELNRIGAQIWTLIAQHSSIDDICAHLAAQYKIDHAIVLEDVQTLLDALKSSGLVAPIENAAPNV